MDSSSTGALIKALRIERGLTQAQMASSLKVTDKAVSKWERDQGLPDISLLADISKLLDVDIERILSGDLEANDVEGGNMKRIDFYVCPECGAVLTGTGKVDISCCGRKLPALVPKPMDSAHLVTADCSGHDCYLTFPHEMTKSHFISFIARSTFDAVLIKRLYPEQGSETYIPQMHGGKIYCYCSNHGLMVADF